MSDVAVHTTFLFTDVEGSTAIWEAAPDDMARALPRHDRLLRDTVELAGGAVFKTVGDACYAVFDDPAAAARAAIAGQRALIAEAWPVGAHLRVRMAVHAGVAVRRDGDYFGPSVNRVARLLAIGHGGQILLSAAAAALVVDGLPPDASLVDLGEHRLKDLAGTERVHQLVAAGLRSTSPALRSQPAPRRHDLPQPVSSFVGRERELARLQAMAGDGRLLTLVGPGGIGKTRLAVELAARNVTGHPDGVRFVALENVEEPDAATEAVAGALASDAVAGLGEERPASGSPLVVLDRCERHARAVGSLVEAMLRQAPALRVVATSRVPLHVEGELVYRVPPLSLPDDGTGVDEPELSDAVALFLDRARRHDPELDLGAATSAQAASICRRLDGLPLAIELAAARLSSMSLAELDARLGPERSVADAVRGSVAMLGARERRVFERLSVFEGGWDLATAEAVAALTDLDRRALTEAQAALCDHSLVEVGRTAVGTRYSMLGAVRDVAGLELRAHQPDAIEELATRHAVAFATLADGVLARGRHRRPTAADRAALGADRANLRVALERTIAIGRWRDAAVLALVLDHLVGASDRSLAEGLTTVLSTAGDLGAELEADVRLALAHQLRRRDPAASRSQLDVAAELAAREDDGTAQAVALAGIAQHELGVRGRLELAVAAADEAVATAERASSVAARLRSLAARAEVRRSTDDAAGAADDVRDALVLARRLDDAGTAAQLLMTLAAVEHAGGHPAEATWLATDAIALADEAGDEDVSGWGRVLLGILAADHGDAASSRRLHLAALDVAGAVIDGALATAAVYGLARAAAEEHRAEWCGLLLGAAGELATRGPTHLVDPYAHQRERATAAAVAALGPVKVRALADRGRALPLASVVAGP